MPRYHRVEDIIQLALALQVPGDGLCLEDVQQRFGVGRRTAERMREAVDRLYPGMSSSKAADGRKYWRLPPGEANALVTWQPEELRALDEAIAGAERDGEAERVRVLAALRDKVETLSHVPAASGRGLAPKPAAAMETLRQAIVLDRQVTLERRGRDGERVSARVHPYGLLGGPLPLLVLFDPERRRARLQPIDEIVRVAPLEAHFERDPILDVRRYAANAFVPFEEELVEVAWRFTGEAADEALEYEFHADQEIDQRDDGSVEVRFRACGLVEMAWHLFTWGDRVEGVMPPILRHRFSAMAQRALDARPGPSATVDRAPRLDG